MPKANLTQVQIAALTLAIDKITKGPQGISLTADNEVMQAWKRYTQTWVLPVLRQALEGDQWHGQNKDTLHDYASLLVRQREVK